MTNNGRDMTYFTCERCGKQKARVRSNLKTLLCATCKRRLQEGGHI